MKARGKKPVVVVYRILLKVFNFLFGFINEDGPGYSVVLPLATYSPWESDAEFKKFYAAISDHTLVDNYRCHELWQLVAQSAKLSGALIEIGVWRGGSGAVIAKSASLNGIEETVYLCDTFRGIAKSAPNDPYFVDGDVSDTSLRTVATLTAKLNLSNVKIIEGVFPDDTARYIKDKTFRFCHIDVDVFNSAQDILNWIWDKLTPGGIIVFDDYGFTRCGGVTKFVNAQRRLKDRLVIHNLNGHGIIIKL